MKKQPKLNHCNKCKAHFSMELGKHVCPPWMINQKSQAPVSVEFCPECMSLKRKPNKECLNHNNYWIDQDEGLDEVMDELSLRMVKNIANKRIKVQDSWDGRQHQRSWYLEAQKMLKKLMKEYERVCKEAYNG